jgi:hypothetical protein
VPIDRAHGRLIGPRWIFRYPKYFIKLHNLVTKAKALQRARAINACLLSPTLGKLA